MLERVKASYKMSFLNFYLGFFSQQLFSPRFITDTGIAVKTSTDIFDKQDEYTAVYTG